MHPVLRFFTPLGRMRRRYYWLVLLGTMLLTSVMIGQPVDVSVLVGVSILREAIGAIVLYVHFCIVAKRLHDMGRSAWWALVLVAIVVIALLLERFAPNLWTTIEYQSYMM